MASSSFILDDFSRGLDLVSSLNRIENGYTPNAYNVRLADGPGFEKILGYEAMGDLGVGVAGHDLFYYQTPSQSVKKLVAASSTIWHSIAADGTVASIRTGLNANTQTSFVSYNGKVYGLDPVNILASWDGTSIVTFAVGVGTGPPMGIILGIWSNRMWVASATAGALATTVVWSEPGDFTSWPAANTVTLGGVGAADIIVGGQPLSDGIMVLCKSSVFMIYDTDGVNRVVESGNGCDSRRSISLIDGYVYGINSVGIFRTNGAYGLEYISRYVQPLFTFENPVTTAAAGTNWNRAYLCSYKRNNGVNNYNDFTLDVDTIGGAILANEYRATCWAQGPLPTSNDNTLYFIDAGNTRYVRTAFQGGASLTTASPGVAAALGCYYETPPLNPDSESYIKRFNRVRIVGRGDIYCGARVDYADSDLVADRFSFPTINDSGIWDTSEWDEAQWGGYTLFDGTARVPVRGRRIALRFYESSSSTFPVRANVGFDSGGEIGSAAVYLVEAQHRLSSKRRDA